MPGKIAAHIASLGIELPPADPPVANYVSFSISGQQIHIAGQVPHLHDEYLYVGIVGYDVTSEDAKKASRLSGINIIAQLRDAVGDLDRVVRCVKLNVFVRSSDEFYEQHIVANGCSDLMVEVFGQAGRHARSSVGVKQLPFGVCVEVDAVFEFI